ncbi:MAG: acetyl-CoA carboxylase biotin carboxylase subunit [Solitalea-like symbiont of Tyrophagus putrescentiae]
MIKKILIANRGEIALRIIRACKELGIRSVAVYSTADADSLHVYLADEAICIGPPQPAKSYLNITNIIAAAELTNSDAIHPGYGFLSENAKFAQICKDHGLVFIGPSAESINLAGNKSNAKNTMIKAGIPTIPGSKNTIENLTSGIALAKEITYPIILKASAGGGGRGMRIVREESEFAKNFSAAKQEAEAAFGNGDIYLEKFIEDPRHIEIQILSDRFGKTIHLSERDCSIQRRHQKLIEETPSPFITEELRDKMGKAAINAAQSIKYEGAGTVEFLVDKHRNFYFMEMNTRIQVEHPVTEEACNIDLIKEQIKIACNEKILTTSLTPQKHSIECRINAEDASKNFRPTAGLIKNFYAPGGRNVRFDSHIYTGYKVPHYYDSLIGKLICMGDTRDQAIETMKRALNELVIEGIETTIPFHLKVMENKDYKEGNFTIQFLENVQF